MKLSKSTVKVVHLVCKSYIVVRGVALQLSFDYFYGSVYYKRVESSRLRRRVLQTSRLAQKHSNRGAYIFSTKH